MASAIIPKFIVYKSSAGSGKTFTLVREYLKIILNNPEAFRQVLAITFTNKAANEMKERVVRNLVILAEQEKNRDTDTIKYLLPQLTEQLKLTQDEIQHRAVAALRLIMHNYAEFAISTIDSFTHRVIRTFAHDLKIPMNFEVELDADTMISEAVDLLVSMVGSEEKLTRVLVDFIEKKADEELSWQIEKELKEFARILVSESSLDAVQEIRKYEIDDFLRVRQALMKWKTGWEKTLSEAALRVSLMFKREGLTAEDFNYKSKGIYSYIRNLADGNFDKIQPNSYASDALQNGNWLAAKAGPGQQAIYRGIEAEVLKAGKQIREMLEKDLPRYFLSRLMLNNLFSTALLSEIEKLLQSICLEDNKLLISEFNRRISDVIQEQPAPFIYERLGERYHHYLIDEFQDTSILQWHNLLPLVENSLASNRMNLVVGDAKQAIYRWRSGDAEQFELLPKLLKSKPDPLLDLREQALVSNYKQENLDQNHRSAQLIVEFNNRLFTSIAQCLPDGYGDAFKNVSQVAARKEKRGLVRIDKIGKDENGELHYNDLVHKRILEILKELEEDQFSFKDIAILCRRNESASKIAAFLISNGIPVISSESLLLSQSGQVNFLVAWIKHLVDPADTIAMAHIAEYLLRHGFISQTKLEDFFEIKRRDQAGSFRKFLSERLNFLVFSKLNRLDIFGLIQYLVFHFRFDPARDSYLQFFQDAVLEFVKTARGGLPEFLEWWEEKSGKLSVVIPEGIDAVRIMTVHKAKGLQFPVVIYPYADEKVKATRKNLWVEVDDMNTEPVKTACLPVGKMLAETKYSEIYHDEMNRSLTDLVNVLYVALTRPEERLYILTKDLPEKTENPDSTPGFLSRFLKAEGTFSASSSEYHYGERWRREKKQEKQVMPEVMDGSASRPALKMLLRRHAPSAWDMEEPEKNRAWGNLLHLALSRINDPQDLDPVLEGLADEGMVNIEQQMEIRRILKDILENDETGRFFANPADSKREPEIITSGGSLYRPDRVLIREGRATVLDFKTGKFREEHREQVINYTRLLKEMNYSIEGAYLLYLDPKHDLMKVV